MTASNALAGRTHFWARRLHSLCGVVPLGIFVIMHLMTNASILGGAEVFDDSVGRIHALGPLLLPVEMVFIFLPLAFHIGYGIRIAIEAKPNQREYNYTANIMYTLQRVTAMIATFFIIYHIWQMHKFGRPLGGGHFDPQDAAHSAAVVIQASTWTTVWYVVGVVSTVFHFANGLRTFLITWGITVGQRSQRIATGICAAIGLVIGGAGLAAIVGFHRHETRPMTAAQTSDSLAAVNQDSLDRPNGN